MSKNAARMGGVFAVSLNLHLAKLLNASSSKLRVKTRR